MAQFDQACTVSADQTKIPTLRAYTKAEACDRTDYSEASKHTEQAKTNELMRREIDNLLKQQKLDNIAPLTPEQMEEREKTKELVHKAYDLKNYQIASPSVVRVDTSSPRTRPELGSAFTIGAQGNQCLLITDYHVVEAAGNPDNPGLVIQTREGNRFPATELIHNAKTDLSVLAVPMTEIKSCPALPMAPSMTGLHPESTRATSIGHPDGSIRQFISGGEVTHVDRTHRQIDEKTNGPKPWADVRVGESRAQVIGGMSGSPTMVDGRAVGVIQSQLGVERSIFTPIEHVHQLLADLRLKQAGIGKIPRHCEIADARKDIQNRIAAKELTAIGFSQAPKGMRTVHNFKDGVQYTIEEPIGFCEVVRK